MDAFVNLFKLYLLNIYIYIYEQYNFETECQNTSKLKHFILIEKQNIYRNRIENPGLTGLKFEEKMTCLFQT